MEIKVAYSDYEKEIRKARIDFGEEQYIDLSFIEETIEEEPEEPVCPPEEDKGEEEEEEVERRVVINTECPEPETTKKILISAKDDSLSLSIDNAVDYGEAQKIVALLQRMTKQI